ncbi:hypothetical protein WJG45_001963 [Klebsiella aerogenes]
MKIREKLKITGRRSRIALFIAAMVMVYFLMFILKMIFIETNYSGIIVVQNIHRFVSTIISYTYYPITKPLWNWIPVVSFNNSDLITFYKPIVPGFAIFTICMLFVRDHQELKQKFKRLRSEVEDEINRKQLRKEAGLVSVDDTATIDVIIDNKNNADPAWHDTWWGKVIIGVVIALIVAAFGVS